MAPHRTPGFYPVSLEAAYIIPRSLGQASDETEVIPYFCLFILSSVKAKKKSGEH